MEENESNEFSWTTLFFVTGISFLAFSGLLKLLSSNHVGLFFRTGLSATFFGILSLLNQWLSKKFLTGKPQSKQQQSL
ncbi:MAG: hypothetical protein J0L56_15180 [Chitinophagales bacterium]|nr:hypothetical protein [Chitinophagales bacterium]